MKLKFNGQVIEIPDDTIIDVELDHGEGPFFRLSNGFTFDAFVCDTGDLGISVYDHGKSPLDDDINCVDIFVDTNLEVKAI